MSSAADDMVLGAPPGRPPLDGRMGAALERHLHGWAAVRVTRWNYEGCLDLQVLSRQRRFVGLVSEAVLRALVEDAHAYALHDHGATAAMIVVREPTVQFLAVDAAHQGRGLGRGLLRAAVDAIRAGGEQPRLWVHPQNYAAIRLYQQCGFAFAGDGTEHSRPMRWCGLVWPGPPPRLARSSAVAVVVGPGAGRDQIEAHLRVAAPHAHMGDGPPAEPALWIRLLDRPAADGALSLLVQPPAAEALYNYRIELAHAAFDDDGAVRRAALAGEDVPSFWEAHHRAAAAGVHEYDIVFTSGDALVDWLVGHAALLR